MFLFGTCSQPIRLLDINKHQLWLFTRLRVGWPPTPQVFFGPWQGLRVVLNIRTGFVSKSFAAIRSPGRPRPRFLPVLGSSQWVLFYVSPRVGASQAREFQIATTTTPRKTVQTRFCTVICIFFQKILQIQCFWSVFACFCNVFLQNTVIYTFVRCKTVPKHHFFILFTMCPIPLFPQTLENTAIYSVFFNFSMFQCRWPTQTYIQKNISNTLFFWQCFYNGFRQKHRNLHVFRHKVGPKHWFLQCFQCSGIQKPFNISLFIVFFSFLSFFPLPEAYQMWLSI